MNAGTLYRLIHDTPAWTWRRPIPQGLTAYLISLAVRAGAGAGLAAAAAGSHQITGTFTAFGLGIAAPLTLEKIAQAIPLTGTPAAPPATADPVPPATAASTLREPSEVPDAR
jgi:hypothetical protein